MISLIAPAGSMEMARQSLCAGADELYVGLLNWSLRSPCFEMSSQDIEELQALVVVHGRKLRVCLNTYPWEHDLGAFDRELERLVGLGIRSFVLADIGNIAAVRKRYPDVCIQASVATDVRCVDDVLVLEDAGATSVTLLRPSAEFVGAVKERTGLSVVVFAFGYLNYTYRARCYMSSYLRHAIGEDETNRHSASGSFNREGFCNRACKCHWSLARGTAAIRGVTMNSTPFLAIAELPDLFRAGADGLKIQGREYSAGLVSQAVRLYRHFLDDFQRRPLGSAVSQRVIEDAEDIDRRRHEEMRSRTPVMIREMLGVEPSGETVLERAQ